MRNTASQFRLIECVFLRKLLTGLSKDPSLAERGDAEEREAVDDTEGHVADGQVHDKHVRGCP